MKWKVLVLDKDGELEKRFAAQAEKAARFKKDKVEFFFYSSYKDLFAGAVEKGDHDHLGLVYDGNKFLDGIANEAFFTTKYGDLTLAHSTVGLVDYVHTREDVASEFLYEFHKRFSWPFKYLEDEVPLETKRKWIGEWA